MKKNILLATFSGILLWLAWPPVPHTGILLLFAFIPLLFAVENVMRSTSNHKGSAVFWLTFLTGVIWNTGCVYWIYNAMSASLPPVPSIFISLIPFCLAPILMGLVFRVYYQMRKKRNVIISFVTLIVFWICYEYLHQTWSLAFPWMSLGNGFANSHTLVQWYEYTGIYGGTVWIWISNILIFILLWQYMYNVVAYNVKVLSLAVCATVLIPIFISLYIYNAYEEEIIPAEVVVVQPNINPYEKYGSTDSADQLNILLSLSKTVGKPNTEFFIWPETAITYSSLLEEDEFRNHVYYKKLYDFLNDYRNASILSGIESQEISKEPKYYTSQQFGNQGYIDYFNAAVLIDQSSKLQFYHKSKLTPGVEQLPFGTIISFLKPLFDHFGGATGGYTPQKESSVLYAQSGIGVAPVICYESIWGDYVGTYIKKGAQFIAIITNDGWWGNTSGKDQHFQYARLRAIENRRWVARSANTGISGFINQRGDIVQKSEWWTPTALTQEINLNEYLTFYSKYGDIVVYISIVFALLSFITIVFDFSKSRT